MLDHTQDIVLARRRADAARAELNRAKAALRDHLGQAPRLSETAASLSRGASASLRKNPAATGVTLVGLAWMALSALRRGPAGDTGPENSPLAGTRQEALNRWADDGGAVSAPPEIGAPGAGETPKPEDTAGRARHPLAVWGLGAALGGAIAAILPLSRAERRRLAPLRQQILDDAHRVLVEDRAEAQARMLRDL
ncbi:MAG: hypothetical protein R3D63_08740 [Paracoccaceae bacterium]